MKKFLTFICIFMLSFALTGCEFLSQDGGGTLPVTTVDLDDVFLTVSSQIPNKDNITSDITLPNKFGSVTIVWQSSDESVISSSGTVNRPMEDTRVVLNCDLYYNGEHKHFEINITVKGNLVSSDFLDILTIKTLGSDKLCKAKGTVVAASMQGVVLEDETGKIYCYFGEGYTGELNVGDKIEVIGTTSVYGSALQFGSGTTYVKKESGTYNPINPTKLTSEQVKSLKDRAGEIIPVKFEGILTSSGAYYNITLEGLSDNTVLASLTSPKQDVQALFDKRVEVTGYFIYSITAKSGITYNYIVATDVKEADTQPTPPAPTYKTFSEVKNDTIGAIYNVENVSVVAIGYAGFLTKDSTDYMYVYAGNGFTSDLSVGDVITLRGTLAKYNEAFQFTNSTWEKTSNAIYTHPSERELSASDFDAFNTNKAIEYISVEGVLRISGNYVNLEVKDSAVVGSLLVKASDYSSYALKTVKVTGYYIYTNGSTPKYANIILTSIEETGTTIVTPLSTIQNTLSGQVGKNYKVNGQIVVKTSKSFLIKDETGYIYCYTSDADISNINVGDVLEVEGATSVFDGFIQFNRPTFTKLSTKELDNVNIREIDKDSLNALVSSTDLFVEKIKIDGKLTQINGNLYIEIEGTENGVVLVYPDAAVSASLDKNVSVTGYFVGIRSGKYLDLVLTNITEKGEVVPPTPVYTEGTIAEIKALTKGTNVKTEGTIIALSKESILIKDESGIILLYFGSEYDELNVGDKVEVLGSISSYNGQYQITNPTLTKKGTEEVDHGTLRVLDGAAFDALNTDTPAFEYVSVKGKLIISASSGKTYYNLSVEGATLTGSLIKPTINLDNFADKNVIITGYFVYVTSSRYVNFILTNIEEDSTVVPGPTYTEGTIEEIIALEKGSSIKTLGKIIAKTKESFLLEDSTSKILVYFGKDYDEVSIGDKVEVLGNISSYNNQYQIISPVITKVGVEEIIEGEANALDAASFDALNTEKPVIKYISIEGKLNISTSGDKKYYNLTVEGATLTGSLIKPFEDLDSFNGKDVKVTGYFIYVSGRIYLNIMLTDIEEITAPIIIEPTLKPISEVKLLEIGSTALIEGTVIAKAQTSILVEDESGMILIYDQNNSFSNINVKDIVKVKGDVATYGGFVQLANPLVTVTGANANFTYPTPIELDASSYEALTESKEIKYVQFEAKVTVNGAYYNLSVEGSDCLGSLVAPVESLSGMNGSKIKVTAYFVYVAGSDIKYISFIYTRIEKLDNEFLKALKEELESEVTEVTGDLAFLEEYEGVTITWSSSQPNIIANNGKFTVPLEDTLVIVTATLSYEGESLTADVKFLAKTYTRASALNNIQNINPERTYLVKGTVAATYDLGFVLYDDAYLYVYPFNAYNKSLKAGDIVVVNGYMDVFNNVAEMRGFTYKKIGEDSEFNLNYNTLDNGVLDSIVNGNQIALIEFNGVIEVSGNYINFAVEGMDVKFSMLQDERFDLTSKDGKEAHVKGLYLYKSATQDGSVFLRMIVTEIEVEEEDPSVVLADIIEGVRAADGLVLVGDVFFTVEDRGFTLNWQSSNENIISNDGKYSVPEEETTVTFTVTISNGTLTEVVTINMTARTYDDINTIKEMTLEELEQERHLFKGVVVATSETDFLIKVEDTYVFVYYGDTYERDLAIGDIVNVRGYLTIFNGTLEFYRNIGYTKLEGHIDVEETFAVATSEIYNGLENAGIMPLTIKGLVRIDGQYVNIDLYQTDKTGSILRNEIDFNILDGKFVEVTGYLVYRVSSYYTFMALSVKEEEMTYNTVTLVYNSEEGYINSSSFNLRNIPNGDIVKFIIEPANEYFAFDYAVINGERVDYNTFTVLVDEDVLIQAFFKFNTQKVEFEVTYGLHEGTSLFIIGYGEDVLVRKATLENGRYTATFPHPCYSYQLREYNLDGKEEPLDLEDYVSSSDIIYLEEGNSCILRVKDMLVFSAKNLVINEDGSWTGTINVTFNDEVIEPSCEIVEILTFGFRGGVNPNAKEDVSEESVLASDMANATCTVDGRMLTISVTVSKEVALKYANEFYYSPNHKGGIMLEYYLSLHDGDIDISYNEMHVRYLTFDVFFFNTYLDVVETTGLGTLDNPLTALDAYNIASYLDSGIYSNEYFYIEGIITGEVVDTFYNMNLVAGDNTFLVYGIKTFDNMYQYGTASGKLEPINLKEGDKVLIKAQVYKYVNKDGVVTIETKDASLIKINDVDATYTLKEVEELNLTHEGSILDPLDYSDCIKIASTLDGSLKEMTNTKYYILLTILDSPTQNHCNFHFGEANNQILVYGLSEDENFSIRYGTSHQKENIVKQGDTILIYGYIQNYNGTYEIAKAQLINIVTE